MFHWCAVSVFGIFALAGVGVFSKCLWRERIVSDLLLLACFSGLVILGVLATTTKLCDFDNFV